ncbi:tetratricopeptide repeat protein [Actinomyces haliotis]|uniref:tetratricopeptide repeat protein n=1 Tax=Actinomyces haliotis TaxID=1280843 RepID=UPI00188F110F|nr:tetratricopeptide repeat protein [Actinomyces haliotis]
MSMFGAVDLSTLVPRDDAQAPGRAPGAPGTPAPEGAAGEGVPAPLVVDVDASTLRDVAQVSTQVPVVIVLHTPRSQVSEDLATQLGTLAREYAGRFELGRVDVDAAPEVAQALQATAVPTVVALLAGQPVPMFQGAIPDDQLRSLIDQLLDVAAQNGVNGRLAVTDGEAAEEPAEPEETEVERAAREALERGDYAAAEEVYDHAIAQNPADDELRLARDQVRMMRRMDGQDPAALIAAADADPADLDKALAAADVSLALGDLDAALGRALEAVRTHRDEERETARKRLLELFDVIGSGAPEVARARRQLASLLF